MAVVHVALERRFLGSFPAVGQDPIQEARRAAAEHGTLPRGRDSEARCLVRDGLSQYRIAATDAGWMVGAAQASGLLIPMGRFASEGAAHDWLLRHLGFARAAKVEAALN
jgi:hypothetical protein